MSKISLWLKTNLILGVILIPLFLYDHIEEYLNNESIDIDELYTKAILILSLWIAVFIADRFTNTEPITRGTLLKIVKADVIAVIVVSITYFILLFIGFSPLQLKIDDLSAPMAVFAGIIFVLIATTLMSVLKFRKRNV